MDARASAIVDLFENLKPADVGWLGRYYTEQAYFKELEAILLALAEVYQGR